MAGRLEGKVILVSGGTRGIGEATVRGIIANGGRVVFGGRDEVAGRTIEAELGENAMFARLDVTSSVDWESFVAGALGRFGKVTGLVNNAGQASKGTLRNISDDAYAAQIAVNQTGTFLGMRSVVDALRDNGSGSIINVSSPAGMKGLPALAAYSAAKAAVIGMSKSVAAELAGRAIRVNVIVPGYFATRLLDESSGGQGREMGEKLCPMRRVAEPEEIVGPMVFLLSDEASYVTGAVLAVDGGLTAA